MGKALHDWDVEVHGITVDALQDLLAQDGRVSLVGKSFGVFKWRPKGWRGLEMDVSIPRRDSKVGPGHRGIRAVGDPELSIVEASRRRDLTVNSMLVDLLTDRLEDPWKGRADLENRILRAVDAETFLEDPLRAVRVVQFVSRLEFQVDPTLEDLCKQAALDELPAERIWMEWKKLLGATRPSLGLHFAKSAGILERVFPEVADTSVDEVGKTLDACSISGRELFELEGRRLALMLAGWLYPHDLHAVEATLDRLGLHKIGRYDARVATLSVVGQRDAPVETDADLRWMSTRAEVGLVLALRSSWTHLAEEMGRARALGVWEAAPPALLQGRDLHQLGMHPGPEMGVLLRKVYAKQLEGDLTHREAALRQAEAWIVGQS